MRETALILERALVSTLLYAYDVEVFLVELFAQEVQSPHAFLALGALSGLIPRRLGVVGANIDNNAGTLSGGRGGLGRSRVNVAGTGRGVRHNPL